MSESSYIHGLNIKRKKSKSNYHQILDEIENRYNSWKGETNTLNSEIEEELKKKVSLLNEYKNYIASLSKYFKHQDQLSSSIIEEFLYLLFKDIPDLIEDLNNGLLFMGQANAYLDLSFAPKNLAHFVTNPGVYINQKKQDFIIYKKVSCVFTTNAKDQKFELIVPAVAMECKAYIPKTMFDQAQYEAQRLKEGNPFALYIIVAEQNALSNDANLKNTKVDEIFILRKQKRTQGQAKKKPISSDVIMELYYFVKEYLKKEWFDIGKATERGRLINI